MREYKLKSPGSAGGLVPLPSVPPTAAVTAAAPSGVPVRIIGGAGAATPRGTRGSIPPPLEYPPSTDRQLLSSKERQPLAILAGQAFAAMCAADPEFLPDMLANGNTRAQVEDGWRHSQILAATKNHPDGQASGLKTARRSHYRTIKAHFLALKGDDIGSLNTAMRTGPATMKAGADGDRVEDIEQPMSVLKELMETKKLHIAYVLAVCGGKDGSGGKFHTRRLESLTRKQLWQLIYTLKNRAAAKEGTGETAHRNKSQRPKSPDA